MNTRNRSWGGFRLPEYSSDADRIDRRTSYSWALVKEAEVDSEYLNNWRKQQLRNEELGKIKSRSVHPVQLQRWTGSMGRLEDADRIRQEELDPETTRGQPCSLVGQVDQQPPCSGVIWATNYRRPLSRSMPNNFQWCDQYDQCYSQYVPRNSLVTICIYCM